MNHQQQHKDEEHLPFVPIPIDGYFVASLTLFWLLVLSVISCVCPLISSSTPWWVPIQSWYLQAFLATITHALGHRNFTFGPLKWWHHAHMDHHISDYPPCRFLSPSYQPAPVDNSQAYVISMLLTPVLVILATGDNSWGTWLWATIPAWIEMYLADVLHMAFHMRSHWLERYEWFLRLRTLHFYHHKGTMRRNLAIADFWLDIVTGVVQLHP